jgi:hypothetical protein
MSLADALERAASALPEDAESIRPANGDPVQLLTQLGSEPAMRVLSWLLTNEASAGAELALAWADEDEGADVLGRLDERAMPKPARKAVRRALHRLRSRGRDVPERREPEPVVARLPEIEDDLEAGYVSAIDPKGTRVVYLVEPNPSGGARMFEILLDDYRGVVDFEVYSSGRSRIRAFLKQMVARTAFPAVPAPVEALRALVAEIADSHPGDRAFPVGFLEHRSRVCAPGRTPGEIALQELGEPHDSEALARAAELVKKGSVGPWGPRPDELAKLAESVLEREAEREPGSENWSQVADEIFVGERTVAVTARRLRESAYVFWKLEREDDARACLAAADCFGEPAGPGNPVAAAIAEVLLTPAMAGLRARASSEAEV